jgi:hypothetical protein
MHCPYDGCKSLLSVPPLSSAPALNKAELLRLAGAGELVLTCPYHDRVTLPRQQQIEFATKWNPPAEI